MDEFSLRLKIQKIVEDNVKTIPYEGDEVDKQGIINGVVELLRELNPKTAFDDEDEEEGSDEEA
jgi:hypothetical protein